MSTLQLIEAAVREDAAKRRKLLIEIVAYGILIEQISPKQSEQKPDIDLILDRPIHNITAMRDKFRAEVRHKGVAA